MADNLTKVLDKRLHYQVQVLVGLGNLSTLWNIGDFYRQAFGNMHICLRESRTGDSTVCYSSGILSVDHYESQDGTILLYLHLTSIQICPTAVYGKHMAV